MPSAQEGVGPPQGDAAPRSLAAREWISLAGLSVLVFVAYRPAWSGGLLWDDLAHLTRADLRSWHGLWRIWAEPGATQQYYPLLHAAFWLEHRLFGDATTGYHLVSIALHCAAAALAALALRRLAVPGAVLAAALFALHPVHAESVAWISEQKNTLSAVLYLGAALAWLGFEERRGALRWLLALALFALALASKTVTATLPAALLLLHWWRRGRPSWRGEVQPLLPFFLLGAAAGLITIWVERTLVGALGAAFDLTAGQRVIIAGRAAWFYLGKLAWPADLAFVYPRWNPAGTGGWQALYPAAALLGLAGLWAVRRRWPAPLVGALYFLGTLAPALGFVNVYPFLFSFVADHFQYLASLGVLALAAAGAARLREISPPLGRHALEASCLAVLAALALLTHRQARLYADRETLYRATIRSNPGCWMAYSNLAALLLARGAAAEAGELAETALQLRPAYPEAENNLALSLAARGRADEAIAHYRTAVELDPGYAEAHNNLGFALAARGELDEALAHYRRALEIDPGRAAVHANLAMALVARGEPEAAIARLRRALELEPELLEAWNNLGILLARSGRLEEAIEQFQVALRIDPASAEVRRNLELAQAALGTARSR